MASIVCPFCNELTVSSVLESRLSPNAETKKRRRHCQKCNQSFRTIETIENTEARLLKVKVTAPVVKLSRVQALENCKQQYAQLLLSHGAQIAENYLKVQAGNHLKESAS